MPAQVLDLGGGSRRALTVVDSHTAGQPTRVIVDGLPLISGGSVAEQREVLRSRHGWVRRVTTLEPRGHRSMMSVALIAPPEPGAHWGAVFMDADGYPDMCGHATIGVATTLVRLGLVPLPQRHYSGRLPLGLDTPAGTVDVQLQIERGVPTSVAFQLPLAFSLDEVPVPAAAESTAARIAYAGQWYAFVDASPFGLEVRADQVDVLVARAADVRACVHARLATADPRTGHVPIVGNVVWCGPPRHPDANACNMPVSAAGSFDRSPCGTATAAKLAILHSAGVLTEGMPFVNEGVLGTLYRARIVREVTTAGVHGIVPEVEGSAHLTGRSRFWVEDEDPLADGFVIGGGPAIGMSEKGT